MKYYSTRKPLAALLLCLLAACSSEEQTADTGAVQVTPAPASTAVVYQGARVIPGDGSPAIESATLVVDNGRVMAVGASGTVNTPAGAQTIDLAGATIMPMMLDTHVHLSTTRDALIQDLRNRVRFGVSAAMSLGMDDNDEVLSLQQEIISGAARYFTAGSGITRPEPGRTEAPHWVNTPEEAREAVRFEAARGVDIIKIWVDDRNNTYEKMTPELYSAVIDEAHQNGIPVTAHIFWQSDAEGLLAAGIDAFAHGVRDKDVDDAFVELYMQYPDVVLVPNLPYRGVPTDYTWLAGQVDADTLQNLTSQAANANAQQSHGIQARNLNRLYQAGATIALGTDGNTPYAAHVEIEDMVLAGMSPMDAIVAATNNGARFLGIDDAGVLAPGMSADFIVLDANPLDDITNTRRIRDVYLRGERAER